MRNKEDNAMTTTSKQINAAMVRQQLEATRQELAAARRRIAELEAQHAPAAAAPVDEPGPELVTIVTTATCPECGDVLEERELLHFSTRLHEGEALSWAGWQAPAGEDCSPPEHTVTAVRKYSNEELAASLHFVAADALASYYPPPQSYEDLDALGGKLVRRYHALVAMMVGQALYHAGQLSDRPIPRPPVENVEAWAAAGIAAMRADLAEEGA